MPIVPPANNYLLGIHKQSAEGTVGTVADYSVPVYGGRPTPTYESRVVSVTDAASIQPDSYKGPSSWVLEGGSTPAFDNALGTFLVGMFATDTATGTAPTRSHAYSGLGGTQPWMSFYSLWPGAGAKEHTFGKGILTNLSFTSDGEGGPLRLGFGAMGQTVTDEASTVTTAASLADGYFGLQTASSYIRGDIDTPNSAPGVALAGVQSITIDITRAASPEPTADSALVTNIAQGLLVPSVTMTWLWQDWLGFSANYFGAAAGTTLSGATVTGALEVFWKHTVSATSTFKLYIPAMVFAVESPEPNPDGSPLRQSVTGRVHKPTSGDHIVPTLINNVTPAY